ncbi:DNA-binding transcriptional activator FeaR [compost metagenome]
MKRIFSVLILLCSFTTLLSAQSNKEDIDKLVQDGKHYLKFTSDTVKGFKLLSEAKEASKRIGYKEGIVASEIALSFFHVGRGDYGKVIEIGYKIEPLALEAENYTFLSDLYRLRAFSHGRLGISEKSYKEFQTSLKYAKKIPEKNLRHHRTAFVYENMTLYFQRTNRSQDSILYYYEKSLEEAKKIEDNNLDITLDAKYDIIANANGSLGRLYMFYPDGPRMDLAEKYFLDALEIHKNEKYKIPVQSKMLLLVYLSNFYNNNGNQDKTIEYATNVLELEKKVNSPYDRVDAYDLLSAAYVEKGDKKLASKYLQLYDQLNDSIRLAEITSIDAPVNHIITQEKNKHTSRIAIIAGGIIVVIAFAVILFWRRKNRILHKNYENLIEKLKTEKKSEALIEEESYSKPSLDKPLNITEETTDALLLKLEKFERSKNVTKKEVSLTWLANHLNTNTRYLSEVIKKHKGKSFTNYINGLRINYIVELLYEEPKHREYKISYLAELCGFSSREVFTTIFKKETGISPSYFIDHLKNDINIHHDQEADKVV